MLKLILVTTEMIVMTVTVLCFKQQLWLAFFSGTMTNTYSELSSIILDNNLKNNDISLTLILLPLHIRAPASNLKHI